MCGRKNINGYTWRENMGKSLQEFMEEYKRLTETGMEHTPVAILNSWMRSLKEMSHNQDFLHLGRLPAYQLFALLS